MKILASLFLMLISLECPAQPDKIGSTWLFAYYMPYDNNLSVFADSILHEIQQGITSRDVVATVQADYQGAGGMKRFIITSDTVIVSRVETDHASNTKTFVDYLHWIAQSIKHKRRAIIFLDHGGKLDEVALDSYPSEKFFRVDSLRSAMIDLNVQSKTKTEFLFLQVCTKGSIEPLYEFRECANYTMASQSELGAPNYYYRKFFQALSESPFMSVQDIAKSIVANESATMYNSLTCIDNSAFPSFRKRFVSLIRKLPMNPKIEVKRSAEFVLHYDGQTYYDLMAFLNGLQLTESKAKRVRDELLNVVRNKLIVFHTIEPSKQEQFGNYSGLSLLSLSGDYEQHLIGYRHLQFFSDFDMKKLYRSIRYSNH